MSERLYSFKTRNFTVTLDAEPDEYPDMSWDETGETQDAIDRGELTPPFVAICRVYACGVEVGSDSLGGCIYESPEAFAHEYRGEYFRDMILEAVAQARKTLHCLRSVA